MKLPWQEVQGRSWTSSMTRSRRRDCFCSLGGILLGAKWAVRFLSLSHVLSCCLLFSPLLCTAGSFAFLLSYFFSSPVFCSYLSVFFSCFLLLYSRCTHVHSWSFVTRCVRVLVSLRPPATVLENNHASFDHAIHMHIVRL
jgi:hypothetical protein